MNAELRARLSAVPRIGWLETPSPVTALPELASALGARWLGIKRDDAIEALGGSTKVRKFDTLLAREPLASAPRWASIGAIGSGHVRALGAAAAALGKSLDVALFDEVVSDGVLDNLAWTLTHATGVRAHRSRVDVLLRSPSVLLRSDWRGAAVIPPGATSDWGTIGVALGVFELAAQVASGEVVKPTRIVAAYGSGGTVAGLALGLGLVGWTDVTLHAVRVVEAPFTPQRRIRALAHAAWRAWRAEVGEGPDEVTLPPIVLRRAFLGRAYGHPTAASIDACDRLAAYDVPLEPVYTGKAMAALLSDAGTLDDACVLFWNTRRGPLPPAPEGWRERVPKRYARHLDPAAHARGIRRRRLLLGAGALGSVGLLGTRVGGYDAHEGAPLSVLSAWEAQVVAACTEALFEGVALPTPDPQIVAQNVDRFLVGMPPASLQQVHALLALLEQGTPLSGFGRRFTRLSVADRRASLEALASAGAPLSDAYRGIRDLVMVGVYSDPSAWPALDYEGPLVPPLAARWSRGRDRLPRPPSRYDDLLAPAGAVPPSGAG